MTKPNPDNPTEPKLLACLAATALMTLLAAAQAGAYTMPDSTKRKEIRDWVLHVLPKDETANGRVSVADATFAEWGARTGELPPDFDLLPGIPSLPDPLLIDEGTRNIPVKTQTQWLEKKAWMRQQLQHYILGSSPPPPGNLRHKVLNETKDGDVTLHTVELSFGPDHQAKLTIELMIPPGKGPFPVFLTQWNHREWAQIAVRRGYIGCVYAAADSKDDSEEYARIWWPQYDFSRLMRRVYATSRAVDFLFTQPLVDKEKIALTGHSRNGKLSLMAAALDERIAAVNTSSSGTGGEVPWRYCSHRFDVEDLALLTCAQPAWFHPRLRYFVGREHKLPIDQNSFMALVAPRGLMLSTAVNEVASNPWGIEQAFHETAKVYRFLGKEENLAIRSRQGKHSVSAKDIEDYVDFFDYVFGRSSRKPENKLNYPFSYQDWLKKSGEKEMGPPGSAGRGLNADPTSASRWEAQKKEVLSHLRWVLGEEPPGVTNPGPKTIKNRGGGEDNFGTHISRPRETPTMSVMPVSPYHGFGDNLFGYLYYPKAEAKRPAGGYPVFVYLHEYDYSKGFGTMGRDHEIQSFFEKLVDQGIAVFSFDMLGFGNRIEEGTHFYERYPRWSKMGKMVADVRGAVDALANMEFLDSSKIYTGGFSLGGTLGLMSAALDNRIAGVVSVSGITPFETTEPAIGHFAALHYSHLHGLIPRLGFFLNSGSSAPLHFGAVVASLAPRPALVISPEYDRDNPLPEVKKQLELAQKVYALEGADNRLQTDFPNDYSRLSSELKDQIVKWLAAQ